MPRHRPRRTGTRRRSSLALGVPQTPPRRGFVLVPGRDNRPMIRLFVGLGNPGAQYEATRHNAGFWWTDAAAARLAVTWSFDRGYHGLVARLNRPAGPIWLLKPQTYMNLSGKSVAALARFFKLTPEQILVVHDELDLVPGQVKMKLGGGVAGHNGLRDIQAQLGSADYWRLRLGIGHPGVKTEVTNWVLQRPTPEHATAISDAIVRTMDALPLLLDGPIDRAVAKVQAKPREPKPVATPAKVEPS
jgi:peptidyl-tRNA hydrolase, PTH1 family